MMFSRINILWAVTHLLAIEGLSVGLLMCLDPNVFASHDRIFLQSDSLDPVSSFFFRGDGSFKLALSLFTLVVSKIVVARGYATWQQTTELMASMYFGAILPMIPVLHSHMNNTEYFDERTCINCMVIDAIACAILAMLLLPSLTSTTKHSKTTSKWTTVEKVAAFFMLNGFIFGIQLLWSPQANFGPNAPLPFFATTGTHYQDDDFSPLMTYAGRMFGASHVPFLVALWYFQYYPTLVSCLVQTITLFFYPIDWWSTLGVGPPPSGIMNRPTWILVTVLHTACLIVNYKTIIKTKVQVNGDKKTKVAVHLD